MPLVNKCLLLNKLITKRYSMIYRVRSEFFRQLHKATSNIIWVWSFHRIINLRKHEIAGICMWFSASLVSKFRHERARRFPLQMLPGALPPQILGNSGPLKMCIPKYLARLHSFPAGTSFCKSKSREFIASVIFIKSRSNLRKHAKIFSSSECKQAH